MDAKVAVTYCIQGLAVMAGSLSVLLILPNLKAGNVLAAAIDAGVLYVQYWVFCAQSALRAHIRGMSK